MLLLLLYWPCVYLVVTVICLFPSWILLLPVGIFIHPHRTIHILFIVFYRPSFASAIDNRSERNNHRFPSNKMEKLPLGNNNLLFFFSVDICIFECLSSHQRFRCINTYTSVYDCWMRQVGIHSLQQPSINVSRFVLYRLDCLPVF